MFSFQFVAKNKYVYNVNKFRRKPFGTCFIYIILAPKIDLRVASDNNKYIADKRFHATVLYN